MNVLGRVRRLDQTAESGVRFVKGGGKKGGELGGVPKPSPIDQEFAKEREFHNSIPMIGIERRIDGASRRARGSSFAPPIYPQIPIITPRASRADRISRPCLEWRCRHKTSLECGPHTSERGQFDLTTPARAGPPSPSRG